MTIRFPDEASAFPRRHGNVFIAEATIQLIAFAMALLPI